MRYLLITVFFAGGLMAKSMLVTAPVVLILLDYWPLGRYQTGRAARLILEKVPLFLLSAVSSVITVYAQKKGGAVASLAVIPFKDRLANSVTAYGEYLARTVSPDSLAGRIVERNLDSDTNRQLVDSFIDQVSGSN
jgi:hypothetical protein